MSLRRLLILVLKVSIRQRLLSTVLGLEGPSAVHGAEGGEPMLRSLTMVLNLALH